MIRTHTAFLVPALALAIAATAAPPAAAEGNWQLKLFGVYAESTESGAPGGSFGGGLAIEYRATPLIGVELAGLTTEFEDEERADLFEVLLITKSELRVTPILARLNFHLTPDRRADFYLGPVAGWVAIGDLAQHVRFQYPEFPGGSFETRFRTEDQFTWGGHLGVDVRLGAAGSGSFLTAGVTYLDLPLEVDFPVIGPAQDGDAVPFQSVRGDLDPLVAQLGYSFRF